METLADIRHIKALLGWEPKIAFADGLHQMMDLMKKGEA
jgi:nucleoside-diphosphate-sugar epimerase